MKFELIAGAILTASVTGLMLTKNESENFQNGSAVVIAVAREMDRPSTTLKTSSRGSLYDADDCGFLEKYPTSDAWTRMVMKDLCDNEKERQKKHPESEVKEKVFEIKADLAEFNIDQDDKVK